jgi:hypothetical protein
MLIEDFKSLISLFCFLLFNKKYDDINNDPFFYLVGCFSMSVIICVRVYIIYYQNIILLISQQQQPITSNSLSLYRSLYFWKKKKMKQQHKSRRFFSHKCGTERMMEWCLCCAMAINNRRRSAYTHRCFVFCWALFISSLLYKYTTKIIMGGCT